MAEKDGLAPESIIQRATALLREYDPVAIYLFGSQVSGDVHPASDIDLAVLFPRGRDVSLRDRGVMIARLEEATYPFPVDLVILGEARLPIQYEVVTTGKVLYEADWDQRTDFVEHVLRLYADFEPMARRSYREIVDEVLADHGAIQ
jgi:predicted nucleotidyltransferase